VVDSGAGRQLVPDTRFCRSIERRQRRPSGRHGVRKGAGISVLGPGTGRGIGICVLGNPVRRTASGEAAFSTSGAAAATVDGHPVRHPATQQLLPGAP